MTNNIETTLPTSSTTPQARHCTFCGQIATRMRANKYLCPDGHENWLDPIPGATVYVLHATEPKVLFGTRSIPPNAGRLNTIGGYIDLGENAEQAATREVKEEMGIEVELLDVLRTYTSGIGDRWVLNVVYVARHTGGEPTPGDDLNGGPAIWRAIDDLPASDEIAWPWQAAAQKDLQAWYAAHRRDILKA